MQQKQTAAHIHSEAEGQVAAGSAPKALTPQCLAVYAIKGL